MRSGADLYAWLAALPPNERDAAFERELGLEGLSDATSPGPQLVGHHMIGISAVVRAVHAIPIRSRDVVLDLGAGAGKLLALVHLLTDARVRGVEIQPSLVHAATPIANVAEGDARTCALDDASVVILYCPFEGRALAEVAARLDERVRTGTSDLVVCALGVDPPLRRLRRRPLHDFWMGIWDAGMPRLLSPPPPLAQALAHERNDQ